MRCRRPWARGCFSLALSMFPVLHAFGEGMEPARQVYVAGALLNFHYKEFGDDGSLLDREDGTVPGVVFGFTQNQNKWAWSERLVLHAGDVAYDGHTTTGIPVTARTDQKFFEIGVQARRRLSGLDPSAYRLYAGIDYRRWERDIRSTSTAGGIFVVGPFEIYEWWSVHLGATAVVSAAPHREWSVDLRLTRTLNPRIHVDFHGQYDETHLDLGERFGMRLALPWRRDLKKNGILTIEPYVESWEFGRSATQALTQGGIPVGTVFEPRSETRNLGILLALTRPF